MSTVRSIIPMAAGCTVFSLSTFGGGSDQKPLTRYCRAQGLLLGQYALRHDIPLEQYWAQYGLTELAFRNLCEYDVDFRQSVRLKDGMLCGSDFDQAFQDYAQQRGLVVTCWCPQHVHVFEVLQRRYQHFRWEIDVAARQVRFTNYPRLKPGETPTLYDLITGTVKVEADYRFEPAGKSNRDRPARCRRRRTSCSWFS